METQNEDIVFLGNKINITFCATYHVKMYIMKALYVEEEYNL